MAFYRKDKLREQLNKENNPLLLKSINLPEDSEKIPIDIYLDGYGRYKIDLTAVFKKASIMFAESRKNNTKQAEYLSSIKGSGVELCKGTEYSFEMRLDIGYSTYVEGNFYWYSQQFYMACLAYALIILDEFEINDFLDYQEAHCDENFKVAVGGFVKWVDFTVYDFVASYKEIFDDDNKSRREQIKNWAKKKRENSIANNKATAPIKNAFIPINIDTPSLQSPAIPKRFEYSNKENYFYNDKTEDFRKLEIELLARGFLDNTGNWIEKENKLVALIHILYKLKYLRKVNQEDERKKLNRYKRFFQIRYLRNISKSFQGSQFKISTLGSYKSTYYFITDIDKI